MGHVASSSAGGYCRELGELPVEAGQFSGDPHLKAIRFSELRDDWYRGVDLMARLVARASAGEPIEFEGFPRQWLPLFALWRVSWRGSIDPPDPTPIVSEFDQAATINLISAAQNRGQLRTLVEAWAALDPLIADVLHRLDRRCPPTDGGVGEALPLTGWQSYGRAEVQAFNALIASEAVVPSGETAVLLPCARARPYRNSRTHRRIWSQLTSEGLDRTKVHQIVISSIGVVPEAHWEHPVALAYDSGVPDIWRVFRLMRDYFSRNHFSCVYDCLQFEPYSEAVAILAREGLFSQVLDRAVGRARKLPMP
jgi:predicted RNA-binding protein